MPARDDASRPAPGTSPAPAEPSATPPAPDAHRVRGDHAIDPHAHPAGARDPDEYTERPGSHRRPDGKALDVGG